MRKAAFIAILFTALSCSGGIPDQTHVGPVYPDYMNVTVPCCIAPLNFSYTDAGASSGVTTFSCQGKTACFKGADVRWRKSQWRRFVKGGDITVHSSFLDTTWQIFVSQDAMDPYLVYRLIEPGYEVYSKMGIYQRKLASYRQRAIFENTDFDGCINCHEFNRSDPSCLSIHIRGDHGATLIGKDGAIKAFNTKTDHSLGFCVYPYWHPSGKYIAYSTNNTRQAFHAGKDKLVEVFDLASDVQIYDVDGNRLITPEQLKLESEWETFPSFSPDGKTLYFCRAAARQFPAEATEVRYDLYRVGFDAETGSVGEDISLLVDASSSGKSISFPKPSYDGKYIMYTLSDYGNFSIWHHEADLCLLDLATGESRRLDEVNSADTESWHNWSSNSRWFVISSRRDDGLFTRPYIAHMDEAGNVGKPFMLPQKNPRRYYSRLFMSYNVPEFATAPVLLDKARTRMLVSSDERIPFE